MAVTVNHEGYERRLAVVQQLLQKHGLQASSISTIAYDEKISFAFNNFLYKVELKSPATASTFHGTQPGTAKAPSDGVTSFVLRLSNLTTDANQTNRVQSDVAAQSIARQALGEIGLSALIPNIYAWAAPAKLDSKKEEDFGWMITELKPGVDLDTVFPTLEIQHKENVLENIAKIFAAIQKAKLPVGVNKFGGLTVDSNGVIVSGEATLRLAKPADSYLEWKFGNLRSLLDKASQSPVLQGWEANGVKARIEKFLDADGPQKVLSDVDVHHKVLVHQDLTTNNILFDKETKEITAILDFDWASVSHPLDEYLISSFFDLGGLISGSGNPVETAMLSGDFSTPPSELDDEGKKEWEVAKMWNAAMKKNGAISPSIIRGARQILDLAKFQDLLCPRQLSNESSLQRLDDNKKAELRAKGETAILEWLAKHSF